jgi:protein-S-isoprenylcysteine O-methyltransferase Ste14
LPSTEGKGLSGFRSRGGLWVVAQILILAAVVVSGWWWPGLDAESETVRFCGWLLLVVGGGVALSGILELKGRITPFPAPLRDSTLVTRGIYRYVRHPLYSALICACFGWGLIRFSLPALLLAVLLVPVLAYKARREECFLTDRFPEYADYQRRTAAFIPWLF